MAMFDIIIWDFFEWEVSMRSSYSFSWDRLISGNKRWDLRLDSFVIGRQISSEVSTYTSRLLLHQRISITCIRWTLWENSYYKPRKNIYIYVCVYKYTQLKTITSSSQKGISRSRFLGLENLLPDTLCKAIGRWWRHCSSMIRRCQDFLTQPLLFSQQQYVDCADPFLVIRQIRRSFNLLLLFLKQWSLPHRPKPKLKECFFLKILDCLCWKLLNCLEGCLRPGPAAVPAQGLTAKERDESANWGGIMFSNALLLYIHIF